MTTNMYRVGDYVYFETSSTSPYQIRRIEELNKTSTGNVEAKVMCFYRRRELPHPLIQLADKHQLATTDESPVAMKLKKMWLKAPITEELASQTILNDPSIANLDDDRCSVNTSIVTVTGNNGTTATDVTTDSSTTTSAAAITTTTGNGNVATTDAARSDPLTPKQRNQMKHRELFLSRQVETLPATHIRGKCSVTLLNETESLLSYLNKDDTFFYCLVYDPTQKTLLADKGEIRVGSRYQTEVQPLLRDDDPDASRTSPDAAALETLVWMPQHTLTDRKIDQYLVVSRSVGTFARALDCSSSVKQPSLHMSAAASSRDITLFHAMDTLHQHGYSIETAMCSLVPSSGPVLCRDEMEEWSASEANLFEEALDKYGKDFNDIRQDFLPWKSLKNIVEYYYMWKTTDRYVQQKRVKAVEAESKLKQVYIPNFTKPATAGSSSNNNSTAAPGKASGGAVNGNSVSQNGAAAINNNDVITVNGGKPCESCAETSSPHWYAWGPTYLCQTCWTYWKKYGGLKVASVRIAADSELELIKKKNAVTVVDTLTVDSGDDVTLIGGISGSDCVGNDSVNRPLHKCSMVNCGKEFKLKAHLARHYAQAHGIAIRSGSPRPIMKTRTAFYLHTTGATKLSRRLCRQIIRSKKAARQPSFAINIQAAKQEFATVMAGKQITDIAHLLLYLKRDRGSVTRIANRLGNPGPGPTQDWLILTPKEHMPMPTVVSFPKPPKAADGSLMYDRIPNKLSSAPPPLDISSGVATPAADEAALAKGATVNNCATATTLESAVIVAAMDISETSGDSLIGAASAAVVISTVASIAANLESTTAAQHVAKSSSLKRRIYDDSVNGVDSPAVIGPPAKRPNKDPMPSHRHTPEQYAAIMAAAIASGQPMPRHHMNGKPKIAQLSRTGSGRKQVISWTDAPDDVFFRVSEASRKTRRALAVIDLRRAARKPWRPLIHPKGAAVAVLFPPIDTSPATATAVNSISAASAAAAVAFSLPGSTAATLLAATTTAHKMASLSDSVPASVSASQSTSAAISTTPALHLQKQQQHHHQQQQHSHMKSIPSSSALLAPTVGIASGTSTSSPLSSSFVSFAASASRAPTGDRHTPPLPSSAGSASVTQSTTNDLQVVILD